MCGRKDGHTKSFERHVNKKNSMQVTPGSCGMLCMVKHCWWPYMKRDRVVRAIECKHCTAIGYNLKSVTPAKQFQARKACTVTNQEIQIDFAGPINNEIYILLDFICIDLYVIYMY